MMVGAISRRLKGRSAGELAALAAKNLAYLLRGLRPAAIAARRADGAFDRRWGTETSGLANLSTLTVDRERARHGVRYQPSSGEALDWAVATAGIDPAAYALVDYGAGKGRIAMLASAMGFARAIGVEFSPELCAVARANIARFTAAAGAAGGTARAAEIVHGDAGAFDPPAGPVLAYLYNPFGPPVLAEVVARLERKRDAGDAVWIAYVDPRHLEMFEASGRWTVTARSDGAVLLRAN